jgi:coproporphyrinogen III oxidase
MVALIAGCAATTPATHPCGGSLPVGCSIPTAVVVLIEAYEEQAEKFHGACVIHDFCYRHGAATYDLSREECDQEFYEGMKAACSGLGGLGILDPEDFAKCQLAANQTYEAVREHGEKHYQSSTSTVCEYK